jgi:hypothetical protein
MTIRFRVSDQALLQQHTLQLPMRLLECLVPSTTWGAAQLFSARDLPRIPAELRQIAQRFIGLYVISDGQGTITRIGRMTHRLAVAEQDAQYGVMSEEIALRVADDVEILALGGAY